MGSSISKKASGFEATHYTFSSRKAMKPDLPDFIIDGQRIVKENDEETTFSEATPRPCDSNESSSSSHQLMPQTSLVKERTSDIEKIDEETDLYVARSKEIRESYRNRIHTTRHPVMYARNDLDGPVTDSTSSSNQLIQQTPLGEQRKSIIEQLEKETDLYVIIGVHRSATSKEIRENYRKKIRIVHPDKGGNVRAAAKLNEAYKVLMDASQRESYNRNGNFFQAPVIYAKHVASAVFQQLNIFDPVNKEELLEGDHVYYTTRWSFVSHHGIVVRVDKMCSSDTRIIDFGIARYSNCKGSGMVREVPLREFLPQGKELCKATYGKSSSRYKLASYKDDSDAPQAVLSRARRLLMLGDAEYHILEQNCESVALWCKTGKRYSGQAEKFKTAITVVESFVVCAAMTGFVTAATVITVIEGAVCVSTALILGHSVLLAFCGACLIGVCAFELYMYFSRYKPPEHQPLEVIELISKLDSRDRNMVFGDPCCGFSGCSHVAEMIDVLDESVNHSTQKSEIRVDGIDLPYHVSEKFLHYFEQCQSICSSCDELDFATQVLSCCKIFNAILDLPKLSDGSVHARVISLLKSAEIILLERRSVCISEISVSPFPNERRSQGRFFQVDANVNSRVHKVNASPKSGESCSVNLRSVKSVADFNHIHNVAAEIHPKAQTLERPPTCADESQLKKYMESLVQLTKTNLQHHDRTGESLESYLELFRATVIQHQLVCFLRETSAVPN